MNKSLQANPDNHFQRSMIVINVQGTITAVNDAAEDLFGFSRREMCGSNISLLMPATEAHAHQQFLTDYLLSGRSHIIGYGRVVRGRRKNGSTFLMELYVEENVSAKGVRSFTGLMRDLSSRTRVEVELRQAEKLEAVGRLAGGVAHRFNNLLAAISGNLELLGSVLNDDASKIFVQEARSAADEGAQLTQQLLAFGRRQPIHPSLVDVAASVSDCMVTFQSVIPPTCEVRLVVNGSRLHAWIDALLLRANLQQLVVNAGQAMEAMGGHLTIDVTRARLDSDYVRACPEMRSGEYIVVAVSDDGSGMSQDVQAYALEPFFSTHAFAQGGGMGLSSVYGFIKQSGGHLELQSAAGAGTTVRLYLPAAPDPGADNIKSSEAVSGL
jgi:PAS domain S-box-containing protein